MRFLVILLVVVATINYCGADSPKKLTRGRPAKPRYACTANSKLGDEHWWRTGKCNKCYCASGRPICSNNKCEPGEPAIPECGGFQKWVVNNKVCKCTTRGTANCKKLEDTSEVPVYFGKFRCTGNNGPSNWWRFGICSRCYCDNGKVICNRAKCLPGNRPIKPDCGGQPTWFYQNKVCKCDNGTMDCRKQGENVEPHHTNSGHPPRRPLIRPRPIIVLPPKNLCEREVVCVGVGSRGKSPRFLRKCNWCRCSGGRAFCTRRRCSKWFKPPRTVCYGTVAWKNGCNWCICEDGKAVCTSSVRPPPTTKPPVYKERCKSSKPTDFWRRSCNKCTCVNGFSSCTKYRCPPNYQLPPGEKRCSGKVRWGGDLKRFYCACTPQGMIVCT